MKKIMNYKIYLFTNKLYSNSVNLKFVCNNELLLICYILNNKK